MRVLVDADACPVVSIIEEVSKENQVPVILISDYNHRLKSTYSQTIMVDQGHDSVDYKLLELSKEGDIAVTQDYGLAAMLLGKGVEVIHPNGRIYTEFNINYLLAQRYQGTQVRRSSQKQYLKGPPKRTQKDDYKFENKFKQLILK